MTTSLTATNWDDHFATIGRRHNLVESIRIRQVFGAYRRLLADVALPTAPRILELGAGTGHASLRLVETFGGHATLVERNRAALALSQRLWRARGHGADVTHVEGDLLAYDGRGFDLVHSGGVVEHFHDGDLVRVVRAHAGAVAPGGLLAILVPVDTWRYRSFRAALRAVGKWIYTDEVPWAVDLAPRLFAPHGLTLIAATTCGHERGYLFRRQASWPR
ncbi:MAG: class I SAM-dependent methyltransferase [Myxococcales bacterium]|nr:class I SAM-dependent methyltransferase [Myxococcales bacterium]